jgi:uncharacterized cupredoxin-like copper-binding protein
MMEKNVKKVILMVLIGALPTIALAGCGDSEAPVAGGADTANNSQATEQHGHDAGGHDDEATSQAAEQHGHDSDDDANATQEQSHDARSGGGHEHGSPTGSAGNAADASRTVEIGMDDTMRFTPDSLTVNAGETARFIIRNNGKIPHEFVIGSMSELMEHAKMMRAMPSMQHAEANMLTLAPGAEGELIWRFDDAGTVDFACTIPGHLEAGMKGVIQVE